MRLSLILPPSVAVPFFTQGQPFSSYNDAKKPDIASLLVCARPLPDNQMSETLYRMLALETILRQLSSATTRRGSQVFPHQKAKSKDVVLHTNLVFLRKVQATHAIFTFWVSL